MTAALRPRPGVLVRLWRWLFGDGSDGCSHAYCYGKADPRCRGGNCTSCCKRYCDGECLRTDFYDVLCLRVAELQHVVEREHGWRGLKEATRIRCVRCGLSSAKLDAGAHPRAVLQVFIEAGPCAREQVRQVMES